MINRDTLSSRSEVFLREDIRAILEAIDLSSQAMALGIQSEESRIFRMGFQAAILSIAKACHIEAGQALLAASGNDWSVARGPALDDHSRFARRLES